MLFERKYYTWCTDKHDDDKPTRDVQDYLDSLLLNAEMYTSEQLNERRHGMHDLLSYFKLAFRLSEQYGNLSYTKKIEERLRYIERIRGLDYGV